MDERSDDSEEVEVREAAWGGCVLVSLEDLAWELRGVILRRTEPLDTWLCYVIIFSNEARIHQLHWSRSGMEGPYLINMLLALAKFRLRCLGVYHQSPSHTPEESPPAT